ncbi:MAG: phenol hydroxylase [Rhodanobacter sp.]|nr:MAG: phenol hydroxylase [Rhodanobacter sp.]TAM09342.1 MAG: phenol hydroxylase [Rhodanobacter sp.]TAM36981.1 MAG: phenol hydroxylase [Rhodanobacter sp.]
MQVDIKTSGIRPIRQTFSHLARRFGGDVPATRYQEATFDLQPTVNFHYRPLWQPQYELYDARRTAIVMQDWYAFRDPRHYYYGVYVQTRARQQDVQENNFEFIDRRGMLRNAGEEDRARLARFLVPMRHYEWGANMNNCFSVAYGYGAAITQAAQYQTMDRLGLAQYVTRIGLLLDGNATGVLDRAREGWLHDPCWQGIRECMEELFVTADWFEVLLAQDFLFDGLVYPTAMTGLDQTLLPQAASGYALATEFARTWYEENVRWVDASLRIAVAESEANASLLKGWIEHWLPKLVTALRPWADAAFGDQAEEVVANAAAELTTRAQRAGIALDLPAAATRQEVTA